MVGQGLSRRDANIKVAKKNSKSSNPQNEVVLIRKPNANTKYVKQLKDGDSIFYNLRIVLCCDNCRRKAQERRSKVIWEKNVKCKLCNIRLSDSQTSHNLICPKTILTCPKEGCDIQYTRDEIYWHPRTCLAVLRACPVQKGLELIGKCPCKDKTGKAKIIRGLVQEHLCTFLSKPANVALAVQYLLRKNKSLEKDIFTLKKKVRRLENDAFRDEDQPKLTAETFSEPFDDGASTDFED